MRRALVPIVVLVVGAMVMFLFGFPLRTYVDQRGELARARALSATLDAQNQALRAEAARLQTPSEIERMAREDYGLVQPGQEAYAILPAPVHPTPASRPRTPAARPAPSTTVPAGPARLSGTDPGGDSGGLLARFVHQLEFWT